ncbi:MAG TPA: hypothetical protein VNL77_00825 [Roseiflexaceae bacterium]|nr:hypothetical protein [Roseiflexaceae bacterium]
MALGKQLVAALRRLDAGGTEGPLVVAHGQASARLELADRDRYSAAVRSLEVALGEREAPADARAELSARAAALIRRLSYLEEPLAVWELEGGERLAQLRSSPPQREGEEVAYWEVTLRAAERPTASIARYRWAPGMPEREVVVYPATFALIGRLADSLEAALAEAEG